LPVDVFYSVRRREAYVDDCSLVTGLRALSRSYRRRPFCEFDRPTWASADAFRRATPYLTERSIYRSYWFGSISSKRRDSYFGLKAHLAPHGSHSTVIVTTRYSLPPFLWPPPPENAFPPISVPAFPRGPRFLAFICSIACVGQAAAVSLLRVRCRASVSLRHDPFFFLPCTRLPLCSFRALPPLPLMNPRPARIYWSCKELILKLAASCVGMLLWCCDAHLILPLRCLPLPPVRSLPPCATIILDFACIPFWPRT